MTMALIWRSIFDKKFMQKISTFLVLFISLTIANIAQAQVNAIVLSPNPIPPSLCNGDTIDFIADNTVGNLTSFKWEFNGAALGPQTIFTQNAQFIAGTPGTYIFTLTVSDGTLSDTLNFSMTVDACNPPVFNFSGTPTTVCEGNQVAFTDASTPGSSAITNRLWVFPGGTPGSSSVPSPFINYNVVGTYSVYLGLTDSVGNYTDSLVDYITVVTCPVPVAEFTANPTEICFGDPVSFLDQSLNVVPGQTTWSWSFPGSNTPVSTLQNPSGIVYPIPGKYDVTLIVTNPNGSSMPETKLEFIVVDSCTKPIADYTVEKFKICEGTCVQFFNNSQREDTILWHFFGANPLYEYSSASNPIVCYDDTGTFDVQLVATNDYGADFLFHPDTISVKEFPEAQAPSDTAVLIGNSVKLTAFVKGGSTSSGIGYRWSPDYEIDCLFCQQVVVSPKVNTKYFVAAFNENGCETTDSVNVLVYQQFYRGVPDAFTPNGDDENDVLLVYGNGITVFEFYVYDRHGNIVFESREQSAGWDGTYKGEIMESGVYAYFVKLTYESGYQEILKGNVTLVR